MDNQQQPTPPSNILQVKIVSPKAIVFEGQADSVSSQNSMGKFDVLPQHANFITLVQQVPIIVRKKGEEDKTFQFTMAIVYNTSNRVHIYTDIQQSMNPNEQMSQAKAEALETSEAHNQ